jgi:hypothetical protein
MRYKVSKNSKELNEDEVVKLTKHLEAALKELEADRPKRIIYNQGG